MKVFRINAYLKLPDDFQGGYPEAIDLLKKSLLADPPDHGLEPSALKGAVSLRCDWQPFALNMRYGFTILAESGVWSLKHRRWQKTLGPPEGAYAEGDTWTK